MTLMTMYKQNFLNTTTMVKVDAVNTATVENVFDGSPSTQWATVGYGTNTSTIFSIEFNTSTVVNRIFLQNHNFKQFRMFFNSLTASTFSTDINETTNSDTSNYYTFNSVTVSSIQLQIDLGQTTDTEKAIGEIYFGETLLEFERNPTFKDYKPQNFHKQVIHKMPNGGVSQFIVDRKYKTTMKWQYITTSFFNSLKNIYDTGTAFYFIPFPTTTSWDGDAFETVWSNAFDFRHSSNNKDSGFSGKITLEETS